MSQTDTLLDCLLPGVSASMNIFIKVNSDEQGVFIYALKC